LAYDFNNNVLKPNHMKTSRRGFIEQAAKATLVGTFIPSFLNTAKAQGNASHLQSTLQFSQVALPYDYAALEPYIDAKTMEIHYTKHHAAYIKNINEAVASEKINFKDETEFFKNTSKVSDKARNNGGGAWNHNFFWQIMKPNGGAPTGKVAEAINGTFGSFEKFKEQFTDAGMKRFGSGWAWLVKDKDKLSIGSTANQDNPLMDNSSIKGTPILGLDVWEHAYYLKYQNKRNEYIANWWNVVNWDEVAKRLA
jgi:Fe-Mn family superoxide dismutase